MPTIWDYIPLNLKPYLRVQGGSWLFLAEPWPSHGGVCLRLPLAKARVAAFPGVPEFCIDNRVGLLK